MDQVKQQSNGVASNNMMMSIDTSSSTSHIQQQQQLPACPSQKATSSSDDEESKRRMKKLKEAETTQCLRVFNAFDGKDKYLLMREETSAREVIMILLRDYFVANQSNSIQLPSSLFGGGGGGHNAGGSSNMTSSGPPSNTSNSSSSGHGSMSSAKSSNSSSNGSASSSSFHPSALLLASARSTLAQLFQSSPSGANGGNNNSGTLKKRTNSVSFVSSSSHDVTDHCGPKERDSSCPGTTTSSNNNKKTNKSNSLMPPADVGPKRRKSLGAAIRSMSQSMIQSNTTTSQSSSSSSNVQNTSSVSSSNIFGGPGGLSSLDFALYELTVYSTLSTVFNNNIDGSSSSTSTTTTSNNTMTANSSERNPSFEPSSSSAANHGQQTGEIVIKSRRIGENSTKLWSRTSFFSRIVIKRITNHHQSMAAKVTRTSDGTQSPPPPVCVNGFESKIRDGLVNEYTKYRKASTMFTTSCPQINVLPPSSPTTVPSTTFSPTPLSPPTKTTTIVCPLSILDMNPLVLALELTDRNYKLFSRINQTSFLEYILIKSSEKTIKNQDKLRKQLNKFMSKQSSQQFNSNHVSNPANRCNQVSHTRTSSTTSSVNSCSNVLRPLSLASSIEGATSTNSFQTSSSNNSMDLTTIPNPNNNLFNPVTSTCYHQINCTTNKNQISEPNNQIVTVVESNVDDDHEVAKVNHNVNNDVVSNVSKSSSKLSKEEEHDGQEKVIETFEKVSEIEMFWAINCILSSSDPIKAVKQLINVALICRDKLRNFGTAASITSALNHASISRLRNTVWKILESKRKQKKLLSGFDSLNNLLDPSRNMGNYRRTINSSLKPLLPFYPLHKKDFVFLDLTWDTITSNSNSSKRSEGSSSRGILKSESGSNIVCGQSQSSSDSQSLNSGHGQCTCSSNQVATTGSVERIEIDDFNCEDEDVIVMEEEESKFCSKIHVLNQKITDFLNLSKSSITSTNNFSSCSGQSSGCTTDAGDVRCLRYPWNTVQSEYLHPMVKVSSSVDATSTTTTTQTTDTCSNQVTSTTTTSTSQSNVLVASTSTKDTSMAKKVFEFWNEEKKVSTFLDYWMESCHILFNEELLMKKSLELEQPDQRSSYAAPSTNSSADTTSVTVNVNVSKPQQQQPDQVDASCPSIRSSGSSNTSKTHQVGSSSFGHHHHQMQQQPFFPMSTTLATKKQFKEQLEQQKKQMKMKEPLESLNSNFHNLLISSSRTAAAAVGHGPLAGHHQLLPATSGGQRFGVTSNEALNKLLSLTSRTKESSSKYQQQVNQVPPTIDAAREERRRKKSSSSDHQVQEPQVVVHQQHGQHPLGHLVQTPPKVVQNKTSRRSRSKSVGQTEEQQQVASRHVLVNEGGRRSREVSGHRTRQEADEVLLPSLLYPSTVCSVATQPSTALRVRTGQVRTQHASTTVTAAASDPSGPDMVKVSTRSRNLSSAVRLVPSERFAESGSWNLVLLDNNDGHQQQGHTFEASGQTYVLGHHGQQQGGYRQQQQYFHQQPDLLSAHQQVDPFNQEVRHGHGHHSRHVSSGSSSHHQHRHHQSASRSRSSSSRRTVPVRCPTVPSEQQFNYQFKSSIDDPEEERLKVVVQTVNLKEESSSKNFFIESCVDFDDDSD